MYIGLAGAAVRQRRDDMSSQTERIVQEFVIFGFEIRSNSRIL